MLDGIFEVYFVNTMGVKGAFLGRFSSRLGNDVLQLTEDAAERIGIGTNLILVEASAGRKWQVVVTGTYRASPTEVTIKKLRDL